MDFDQECDLSGQVRAGPARRAGAAAGPSSRGPSLARPSAPAASVDSLQHSPTCAVWGASREKTEGGGEGRGGWTPASCPPRGPARLSRRVLTPEQNEIGSRAVARQRRSPHRGGGVGGGRPRPSRPRGGPLRPTPPVPVSHRPTQPPYRRDIFPSNLERNQLRGKRRKSHARNKKTGASETWARSSGGFALRRRACGGPGETPSSQRAWTHSPCSAPRGLSRATVLTVEEANEAGGPVRVFPPTGGGWWRVCILKYKEGLSANKRKQSCPV